jgi:hypothetical protein
VLEGLLPSACSRLRIFLSYASEHKRIAEELAQTLKNSGHEVFFDKDSLPPGEDFQDQIRAGIRRADRFVFLISRSSLEEGRFTLSELEFARQRWPAPSGRVFPVLLDKTIKPEELPIYLRSVQALSIKGNATAEIAHEIDKTRTTRPAHLAWVALLVLALIGGGLSLARTSLFPAKSEVAFSPPAKIDFRPLIAPPDAGGQDDAWLKSAVAVTALQLGYQHLTSSGANAQLLPEQVEIKIDGQSVPLDYHYEVNIMRNCPEGGWHCARPPKAMRTLAAGEAVAFQSMYRSRQGSGTNWENFIERIANAKQGVTVTLGSRMNVDRGGRLVETQVRHECMIDFVKLQSDIADTRQKRGRIPIIMQPACSYK